MTLQPSRSIRRPRPEQRQLQCTARGQKCGLSTTVGLSGLKPARLHSRQAIFLSSYNSSGHTGQLGYSVAHDLSFSSSSPISIGILISASKPVSVGVSQTHKNTIGALTRGGPGKTGGNGSTCPGRGSALYGFLGGCRAGAKGLPGNSHAPKPGGIIPVGSNWSRTNVYVKIPASPHIPDRIPAAEPPQPRRINPVPVRINRGLFIQPSTGINILVIVDRARANIGPGGVAGGNDAGGAVDVPLDGVAGRVDQWW